MVRPAGTHQNFGYRVPTRFQFLPSPGLDLEFNFHEIMFFDMKIIIILTS